MFLAGIGAALSGGAAIASLFKKQPKAQSAVLKWKDFYRQQDQLNQANPQEMARQGQFLEGIAPSEAHAYNTKQDLTYAQDTNRQKQRLDTLYKGVSPWELAGSNAGGQITAGGAEQAGNPTASPQFLAQAMQTNAQLENTKLQTKSAQNIAKMQTAANLFSTATQRQTGKETTDAQTLQAKTQELRSGSLNFTDQQRVRLEYFGTLAKMAPKEKMETLIGTIERVAPAFAKQFAAALTEKGPGFIAKDFQQSVQGLDNKQMSRILDAVEKTVLRSTETFDRGSAFLDKGVRATEQGVGQVASEAWTWLKNVMSD